MENNGILDFKSVLTLLVIQYLWKIRQFLMCDETFVTFFPREVVRKVSNMAGNTFCTWNHDNRGMISGSLVQHLRRIKRATPAFCQKRFCCFLIFVTVVSILISTETQLYILKVWVCTPTLVCKSVADFRFYNSILVIWQLFYFSYILRSPFEKIRFVTQQIRFVIQDILS